MQWREDFKVSTPRLVEQKQLKSGRIFFRGMHCLNDKVSITNKVKRPLRNESRLLDEKEDRINQGLTLIYNFYMVY